MNPLEAMARSIYENAFPGEKWEDATTADLEIAFSIARAAKNSLADNVDEKMTTTYLSTRVSNTATRNINALSIAAAIRAAGEE